MTEHAWVMEIALFLMCISAGVIFGYMYHTYGETFPEPEPVVVPTVSPTPQSGYSGYQYRPYIEVEYGGAGTEGSYARMYRSEISVNTSSIPESGFTNTTYVLYAGGGGGGSWSR